MSHFFSAFARQRKPSFLALMIFLSICSWTLPAMAQPAGDPTNPQYIQPGDRITTFIDDEQRVTLGGNRHPLAVARFEVGAVAPDFSMQHMILTLLPDADQEAALSQLLEAQHNPESAYYHQWLTPEQYGERFGVSDSDITQVTRWLQGHDMDIDEVTAGRRAIVFSGTASQVESAFHTPIHIYKIGDEFHHANAKDPEIPAALSPVVGGIVSLHDFYTEPMHTSARQPSPEYTSGSVHFLAPADFATIYDLDSLYQRAINGNGQSIAIVARSNIKLSDVAQFRSFSGLPANNPQIIVNGTDPGIFSSGEETEADLDAEWSGAVAPNATIKLVVSKSTNSSDGVDLSAQYIVNHNLAPVMSTSFGLCEAALGSSGNAFLDNLWQQAAAQGISVFVSSGDNGAAGCDSSSAATAKNGLGVNGLCSTPYSICVGGSEFSDSNGPLFWATANNPSTQASALSYIPEVVWNESGPGYGLWASGGGASKIYSKPSWQTGTGVPADGKRDVPDVALTAAGHDGYIIAQEGSFYVVGGTSAASPSFAAIMSLVVQNAAARLGNANAVLYPLAAKQRSGGASVFHDITKGNNGVPGQTGFNATAGYDQATGLGSVDASVLVSHWSDGLIAPAFHIAPSANSISVTAGSNNSVRVNVTVSGGFNAAVSFSITGLPAGVSYSFTPARLSAPGSGSSVLKLTAASNAKLGSFIAAITAAGGSLRQQTKLAVSVTPARKH
jgi:pseudomonalisin